jgi:hypothetical protein
LNLQLRGYLGIFGSGGGGGANINLGGSQGGLGGSNAGNGSAQTNGTSAPSNFGGGGGGGGYDGASPVGRGGRGGSGVVVIWSRDPRFTAEGCDERAVDGGKLFVFSADGFIWMAG